MSRKITKSANNKAENKVPTSTTRLGSAGTPIYGGYIQSNETNPTLSGLNRYKTYSEIVSNISVVAAGIRYFLNVITKSAWKIETPDDSAESRRLADLVQSMIHDMETPWHRVIRKSAMYKFYGFSIQEWIAKKRDDGYIGFLDIESRPQRTIERWDVTEQGIINGVFQRSPQTAQELYLPRARVVYVVDDSLNDNPEGFGLFRHLAEPAKRLQRYEQLEGYGFETDLRGIPIGRGPLSEIQRLVEEGVLTNEQAAAVKAPLSSFIENHIRGPKTGIVLDSITYTSTNEAQTPSNVKQWDLELLKGGSSSLNEASSAIQRINGELARILGVEGLLLGGQGRGSQALSRDKSDNFFIVVDASLKEIASTFDREVIDPIWKINGWDKKYKPKFKTDSIQLRDIEQITSALSDMASAGAVLAPDDPAILEVRDLLGLSHPTQSSMELSLIPKDEVVEPDEDPNFNE